MKVWIGAASMLLAASCDTGGGSNVTAPLANAAASEANATSEAPAAAPAPAMPACPFRETEGWGGAIEGGRLIVNGVVDLQMAGFRPALTQRPGATAGTLALDLALAPEPNASVTDRVRFEGPGGGWRRGEIWCGGERIAAFEIVTID